MRIRRCAAAEEAQGFTGGDLVPGTGWDEDGIAGSHGFLLAVDLHRAAAFEDEIKLLAEFVIVALGGATYGHGGFGQGLVLHRGIGAI